MVFNKKNKGSLQLPARFGSPTNRPRPLRHRNSHLSVKIKEVVFSFEIERTIYCEQDKT